MTGPDERVLLYVRWEDFDIVRNAKSISIVLLLTKEMQYNQQASLFPNFRRR